MPSQIQSLVIPTLKRLPHSIVIAQSPNDSGKTLAFLLPILFRIDKNESLVDEKGEFAPQALVLTSVKELCAQTYRVAKQFEAVFPDAQINIGDPKNLVKSHVLICTPDNLLNLITKKMINLSKLKIFAVDEADYVLTSGVVNKRFLSFLGQ